MDTAVTPDSGGVQPTFIRENWIGNYSYVPGQSAGGDTPPPPPTTSYSISNEGVGEAFILDRRSLVPRGPANFYGNLGGQVYGTADVNNGAQPTCFSQTLDSQTQNSINVCNSFSSASLPNITDVAVFNTPNGGSCASQFGEYWSPLTFDNMSCGSTGPGVTGLTGPTNTTEIFYSPIDNIELPVNQCQNWANTDLCADWSRTSFDAYGFNGGADCGGARNYDADGGVACDGSHTTNLTCIGGYQSSVCPASNCTANYTICVEQNPEAFPVQRAFVDYNYDDCDTDYCTTPGTTHYCTVPSTASPDGPSQFVRVTDQSNNDYDFFAGCVSANGFQSGTSTNGPTASLGHSYLCRDLESNNFTNPTNRTPAPYEVLSTSTSCFSDNQWVWYVAGRGTSIPNQYTPSGLTGTAETLAVRVVNNYQVPPSAFSTSSLASAANYISNRSVFPLSYFHIPGTGSFSDELILVGSNFNIFLAGNIEYITGTTTENVLSNFQFSPQPILTTSNVSGLPVSSSKTAITMISEQYNDRVFIGVENGQVVNNQMDYEGNSPTIWVFESVYNVPTAANPDQSGFSPLVYSTVPGQPNNMLFTIGLTGLATDSYRLVGLNTFPTAFPTNEYPDSEAVILFNLDHPSQSYYYDYLTNESIPMSTVAGQSTVSLTTLLDPTPTTTPGILDSIVPANANIVYIRSSYVNSVIDILYYPTGPDLPVATSFNPSVVTYSITPVRTRNASGSTALTGVQVSQLTPSQFSFDLVKAMDVAYPEKSFVNYVFGDEVNYSNTYWFGFVPLSTTSECLNYCQNNGAAVFDQCQGFLTNNICRSDLSLNTELCQGYCFGLGIIDPETKTVRTTGLYDCGNNIGTYCNSIGNESAVCDCFGGQEANTASLFTKPGLGSLASYQSFNLDSRFQRALGELIAEVAQNPYCSNPLCTKDSTFQNTSIQDSPNCDLLNELECLQGVQLSQDNQGNPVVSWQWPESNAYSKTCSIYNDFCDVYTNATAACGNPGPPPCENCTPALPKTNWWEKPWVIVLIIAGIVLLIVAIVVPWKAKPRKKQPLSSSLLNYKKSLSAGLPTQKPNPSLSKSQSALPSLGSASMKSI